VCATIVNASPRCGALPAVAIRCSVGGKRCVPRTAGVERLAERESEIGAIGRRRTGIRNTRAQSRDQRIIRLRDLLQTHVARQCDVTARLQLQDFFVECASFGQLAEILAQVCQVQQRWNVVAIERQRCLQLTLRSFVLPQAVGIDDAAVEMNFLGLRDAAIECLLI
jgi:hypothetical protein